MYNFTFHRPTTVRQAAGLLARKPEAGAARRRPDPAADHEAAARTLRRLSSSLVEGLNAIELRAARS